MTSVFIVDDQEMIRVGLRSMLQSDPGIEIAGEAGDGIAAVSFVEQNAVDVVLMDIRMPGLDGVEATRRIRASVPADKTRIIILTTFEQDENVLAALRAGANGFLSKAVGPQELLDAVREVSTGGGALSAAAAAALIEHVSAQPAIAVDHEIAARFEGLTATEHEVVLAIASGENYEQIAAARYVSPYTVKTHANRAMAKVGARDRAQLVALAHRAGLVR